MRHEIEVEIPTTTLSGSDIVVTVNANGRKLGVLTFSRGAIDWRASLRREKRSLPWARFAELMEEHGRNPRTQTRA